MAFTTVLFYPWIDISDEKWIRTACLYWDRIHTIVPKSIRSPYQHPASRELEDAGILRPLRVESRQSDVRALAGDVLSYLESQEANELLLGRFSEGRQEIHLDKLPLYLHSFARIHPDKLPYEVLHHVKCLGTAKDGWVRVGPRFAEFYMTLLATRLAEKGGFGLLTDSAPADRLSNTVRLGQRSWKHQAINDAYSRTSTQDLGSRVLVEGTLVDMIMGGFSVAPNVPLKKVLAFRKRHADELGRFRTKIGDLVKSVPTDTSLPMMRQHVKDLIANEIKPALGDLRGALRGSGVKVLTEGLLKVSSLSVAPTSALVIAGLIAAPTALLVGAGISLTATAALYSYEKGKILRKNPFTYLLQVQSKFN